MVDTLNITLAPQLVLTVTHNMGGVAAGFTVIAGISRSTGGGAGNEYLNAEKVKLAGIETGATADQTGAEIKVLYELEADTNAFNDLAEAKLGDIEDDATADQSNSEIKTAYEANSNTNVHTDAQVSKLAGIESGATGDQSDAEIRTAVEAATNSNVFTDTDHSKLDAIEANATADQTDAQIRTAIEAASDSNVFTDTDHSKLNAIEAGATTDQTNAEIRTAVAAATNSNVFTDSQQTSLGTMEDGATADQSDAEIRTAVEAASDSNVFTDNDHSKLDAIEDNATADQTDSEIATAYGNEVAQISAGEITAGTESTLRTVAPDDLVAMITEHAPAAIASAHYQDPVENIAELTALPEAGLVDAERRFVEIQVSDYFYDIDATSGDEQPDDQTGGTGFWITVADTGGGSSPAQIKSKYEKNANTNAFEDAEKTSLATMEDNADVTDADNVAAAGAVMDSDITAGEGFLRKTGAGAYVAMKSNLGAATNPVVTSDTAAGYVIGSRWINTTLDTEYVCVDATNGAAVWEETSFPVSPVITGHLSWLTDVQLWRDEAGCLAQRDGANNQRQRWYGWYTDTNNGEWGEFGWNGGIFYIGSFSNGTGTGRPIVFITDDTARWAISATGAFAPAFDNAVDIGLDGFNRPKDVWLAGTLTLQNVTANKSSMVVTGYSLTGSNAQNMIDLSGTWNTTGAPTLIYADILDTASDAGAMLINIKVGGTSMISVTKAGHVTAVSGLGLTDAEVRTAVDAATDSNVFTDAEQTSLGTMEDNATADQSDSEIKTAYENNADTNVFDDTLNEHYRPSLATTSELVQLTEASLFDRERRYVVSTKSDYYYDEVVSTGDLAPADQTGGTGWWFKGNVTSDNNIKIAYEANSNTNAFTDADETKLDAIEETEVNPFTDDHTLALTDAKDIVEMNKATANVLLIPTNASVAFASGTVISIMMMGAGTTSITADTGVTLNGVSAGTCDITDQFKGASLYKSATDAWVVTGAIGDVT